MTGIQRAAGTISVLAEDTGNTIRAAVPLPLRGAYCWCLYLI